jgi:sugar/nucleoside kinase (ribokinase family)
MKKVTVCGHIAHDIICDVPYHPEKNHSIYIEHLEECYGGGAANIAVGIARLGGKSELVAAVTNDFAESQYGQYLQKEGIHLRVTQFAGELPRAYIFNNREHLQITYFSWGVSEYLPKVVSDINTVHLAPVHPKFACAIAPNASFLAFEPGQDMPRYEKKQLLKVLEHTNLLFVNEFELNLLEHVTSHTLKSLVQEMDVVVTQGNKGCNVFSDGKGVEIPAVPTMPIDPTGAGDAHRATCWAGLQRGMDLVDACRLANIAASLVVKERGAQKNLPDWETLCAEAEKI